MKKLYCLFFYLCVAIGLSLVTGACSDDDGGDDNKRLATPAGIEATSITETSAEFTWRHVEGATGYTVQLKTLSASTPTEVSTPAATITFDNLTPETTYSVRVMANAQNKELNSEFSDWYNFVTSNDPQLIAPLDLAIGEVTSTSAVATWSAVINASGYRIEISDEAQQVRTEDTSERTFEFTGLDPEATYTVRVMAKGDGTDYIDSEYSAPVDFTTDEGEIASDFSSGSGTEQDPYIIKTDGQLALLAKKVNDEEEGYVNAFYKLGDDIDLDGRDWTPIGSGSGSLLSQQVVEKPFNGTFDGDGHTVSNLNCTVTANEDGCFAGLFGLSQGKILNLSVEGRVESNSSFSGINGYSFAAGVCAVNYIGATISGCKFTGSAKATSTTDPDVIAYAGGICALMMSGEISMCEVTVDQSDAIEAIGCGTIAGGVCGYSNAGNFQSNSSLIKGRVSADIMDNVNQQSMILVATAGGVIGGSFAIMLSGCDADVQGSIKANNPYGVAHAAGVCGTTEADVFGGCSSDISGSVEATSAAGNTYAAGIVATLQGSYGFGGCHTTISGTVSSITTGSAKGAFIAGVGAHIGNAANAVSTNACTAAISGTLRGEGPGAAFGGGIIGQSTGSVTGSSTVMENGSKFELKGNQLGFGGIIGVATVAHIRACYSILDGNISATSDQMMQVGGITGTIGGRVSAQTRTAVACYSLIGGTVTTSGSATPLVGGISGGAGAYGRFNTTYWWCGNSSVTQGNGANATTTGITMLAERSKDALEAIVDDLDAEAETYMFKYEYDATKQYLVLVSMQ